MFAKRLKRRRPQRFTRKKRGFEPRLGLVLPCLLLFGSAGRAETLPRGPSSAYSLSDINAGHIISKALSDAYPGVVEGPIWEDDDWVLVVRGKKFFWAAGRLLDAEAKAEPDYLRRYRSYRFYDYPEELPPSPRQRQFGVSFSDEQPWQGWRTLGGFRGTRNMEFFQTLLDVRERSDMLERNVAKIRFLGHQAKVHQMIVPALRRIDKTLQQARSEDTELDRFLKSLRSASAYVWRNIAGTKTLSLHSYGIAVDLIPKRWLGDPDWLWVKNKGLDWRDYPYEKRWQLPEIVIKTFEREGFIWGGKWYRFDTMHFEYHPELQLLKPYFRSLE
ncbi:MAG: M15 family metallopeptidase [Spirochaetota bacterium]